MNYQETIGPNRFRHADENPTYLSFAGCQTQTQMPADAELRGYASDAYREMHRQFPTHYPELKLSHIPGAIGVHSAPVTYDTETGIPTGIEVSWHSSMKSKPKVLATTGPTSSAIGMDMAQPSRSRKSYTPINIHPKLEELVKDGHDTRPRHAYSYRCAEPALISNHYYNNGENAPLGRAYVIGPGAQYLAFCGADSEYGYGCRNVGAVAGAVDIGNWPQANVDEEESNEQLVVNHWPSS